MKILSTLILLSSLDLSRAWSLRQDRSVRVARKVADAGEKRVVCYYANWAVYRGGESKFQPQDIHPHLCTHVLYAFATLEKDVGLVPFDSKQDIELEGYSKFIELKKANPDLQLILSVGGTKEGSSRFSKLAADPELTKLFAKNGRIFLEQFGFDGLDLVWQYPAFTEGSLSSDKENYVKLVKECRNEFKDDYIISMAVPSLAALIERGFDLPELTKYLDFMNVLTYNYHEATEPTVNHVAPLYAIEADQFKDLNIDTTINTYMRLGVDPAKLNLGIPLYGISFILEDAEETDIGSPTEDEGPGNQERGAVIYNIFCKQIKEERWTVRHVNQSAIGPYAYRNQRWVAYDDEDMIRTKAKYAVEKKLGGIMFWSIDMDDFRGNCHPRAYPLIKAGRETFLAKPRLNSTAVSPPETTSPTAKEVQTTALSPTAKPRMTPTTSASRRITPARQTPSRITTPSMPTTSVDNFIDGGEKPNESNDIFDNQTPSNDRSFHSSRDIVFQNVKVWITNHYYS